MKKTKRNSPAEWSDKQIMKEVKALRVAYGMKRTLRYNTKRNLSVHNESVAEHVFASLPTTLQKTALKSWKDYTMQKRKVFWNNKTA